MRRRIARQLRRHDFRIGPLQVDRNGASGANYHCSWANSCEEEGSVSFFSPLSSLSLVALIGERARTTRRVKRESESLLVRRIDVRTTASAKKRMDDNYI